MHNYNNKMSSVTMWFYYLLAFNQTVLDLKENKTVNNPKIIIKINVIIDLINNVIISCYIFYFAPFLI